MLKRWKIILPPELCWFSGCASFHSFVAIENTSLADESGNLDRLIIVLLRVCEMMFHDRANQDVLICIILVGVLSQVIELPKLLSFVVSLIYQFDQTSYLVTSLSVSFFIVFR
nr:hypothetical protein Iba_chr06aCG7440 [Ipomoea batatas]